MLSIHPNRVHQLTEIAGGTKWQGHRPGLTVTLALAGSRPREDRSDLPIIPMPDARGPDKTECDALLYDIAGGYGQALVGVQNLVRHIQQNQSSVPSEYRQAFVRELKTLRSQIVHFLRQCGGGDRYSAEQLSRLRQLIPELDGMINQIRDPSGMGRAVVDAILAILKRLSQMIAPLLPNPEGASAPRLLPLR